MTATPDESLIEAAVVDVVKAAAETFPRVAYGNQVSDLELPYLIVRVVPSGMDDKSVGMTSPVWSGFILATVVTHLDEFETEGKTLARQFGNLFQAGSRITLSDGYKIMVRRHPNAQQRYRDSGKYRYPVQIDLRTERL